ncbi:Proliferating cell nuclear antigen [Lymphocystis disease virus 1]|uniref:Proliferating cell nuclear antigen n=1 Tax=Fish lymphocystis disease virus TaxID=36363 RepID=UPI0000161EC9|nr:Proliferating cell nuclear antigen [Lymphocystis disease virus 1]
MFTAIVSQAAKFKNLIELLFNNLDTIVLQIDKSGISINESVGCIDINVQLPNNYFLEYKFTATNAIYLGLSTNVAYDFKTIKNKAKVKFSIVQLATEIEPLILKIETFPPEGELQTAIILTVEAVVQDKIYKKIPSDYTTNDEIKILAKDFASTCKSFKSGLISVSKIDGRLIMSTSIDGLKTKEFVFGKELISCEGIVHFMVPVEKMLKLTKLAAFADKYISVIVKSTYLIFKAVNDLGIITIKCNS